MALKYTSDQRGEYLRMTDRIGARWLDLFDGNTEFYSAVYWDLLTTLWRNGRPLRKTDVLPALTGVKSAHTAARHIDSAIRHGLLVEMDNPEDARSKLLDLTPETRGRLDTFFDAAIGEILRSGRTIGENERATDVSR